MKAVELCYWLQGYFEIGDANGAPGDLRFNPSATKCLRAHLALVAKCDPKHGNAFVSWLAIELDDDAEIAPDRVAKIRRTLAKQFKHEIDPTYAGNPSDLQSTHDDERPPRWRPDQVIRC